MALRLTPDEARGMVERLDAEVTVVGPTLPEQDALALVFRLAAARPAGKVILIAEGAGEQPSPGR